MEVPQDEVAVAAKFIRAYLPLDLPKSKASEFQARLEDNLRGIYEGHWYPEDPNKGSGYRCLVCTPSQLDPSIRKAAEAVGIDLAYARSRFPENLVVWVDPMDVSYKLNEFAYGPTCLWKRGKYQYECRKSANPAAASRPFSRPHPHISQVAHYSSGDVPSSWSMGSGSYSPAVSFSIESDSEPSSEVLSRKLNAYHSGDSPYSTRSNSPSSASPDFSEEEDSLQARDDTHASRSRPWSGYLEHHYQRGVMKKVALSRGAPSFAPRVITNQSRRLAPEYQIQAQRA